MLDNSYGSVFFFIFYYKNLKTSDETYGSFWVEDLHDERGKLIKGDTLFHNIFDFWACIHCEGFIHCNEWYHPKTAKLRKVLRKKWDKIDNLPIINVLLKKIKEGEAAFNPTNYLGKEEESFSNLQTWKTNFEKSYLEKYRFLTRPPIRHKKIVMRAPRPNIR